MLRRAVALVVSFAIGDVQAVLGQGGQTVAVSDGTRVRVRLLQTISSETSKPGEPVNLEVMEDVTVEGAVLIRQGTPAGGVIVEAEPRKRMGRAGRLVFSINETKSVGRQTVRLRSSQAKQGDSHVTGVVVTTAITAVLLWPAAPFMLLRRGKPIGAAEGTRFEAFVDGDHAITALRVGETDSRAAISPVGMNVTSPTGAAPMRNDDVIKLVAAGIGDDVVISKIGSSLTAFELEADNLVQLKKAGVSDKVLSVMLVASTPASAAAAERTEAQPTRDAPEVRREEWMTSLPGTAAFLTPTDEGLRLELVGSSEFGGFSADLRQEANQLMGSAPAPGCTEMARWQLRQEGNLWQGSFECRTSTGRKRAVSFVLSRPQPRSARFCQEESYGVLG